MTTQRQEEAVQQLLKSNVTNNAINGIIMLALGWLLLGEPLSQPGSTMWYLVMAGWLGLKWGGMALLIVSGITMKEPRAGYFLDVLVNTILAGVMIVVALAMVSQNDMHSMLMYGIMAFVLTRTTIGLFSLRQLVVQAQAMSQQQIPTARPGELPPVEKVQSTSESEEVSPFIINEMKETTVEKEESSAEQQPPEEEPPGGFLASFADRPHDSDEKEST